jgi:hypothetical protein
MRLREQEVFMTGKQMEGDNRQRRTKAKLQGGSAAGVTLGASKQRRESHDDEEHDEQIENIHRGKQKVIRQKMPHARPRSRQHPKD